MSIRHTLSIALLLLLALASPTVGQRSGSGDGRQPLVDLVTPPLPHYPTTVLFRPYGCHAVNAGPFAATVKITIFNLQGVALPHGTIPETADAPGPHCPTALVLAPGQTCSVWSVADDGAYCRISVSAPSLNYVRGALVDGRTDRVAEAR